MLKYVNRSNTNCYKWDSPQAQGKLPMWVADMDFQAAQPILDALQQRLNHGVFGYQCVPQAYYDAISNWFCRRHNWHGISREQIIYTTGVVPAIATILRAKTKPNDKVLTLTPAYNCFFSCIQNLECQLLESRLLCVDNHFEIDWNDFENKASEAAVMLLCNPHNPTGRVWTADELERIADICEKHHLFVVSDEIHCELVFPNQQYTPYAIVAHTDDYCVCNSASKAFNIAGLQCANIYVPNAMNYQLIDHAINVHEVCDINPFGMVALIAAYNESEQWLDELNQHIFNQYSFLADFLRNHLPSLQLTRMEGTYLAWVNVSALHISSQQLCNQLSEQFNVLFNPAEMYGAEHYIRINLATSQENLQLALQRLEQYIKKS